MLILFPVMVGILLTQIFIATDGLPLALILWAVLLWMIADNRPKYQLLLEKS